MIVGGRRAGLSITITADLLGFSCTTVSREWCNKEKNHPLSGSSEDGNALLMSEVNGE